MLTLLFSILCMICLGQEIENTKESYATLNPDIHKLLVSSFLPSDYILSTNIYEWNVTEIVYYINEKDPDTLYAIDTSLLFTLFPENFIKQLPRDILISHKLYYYLPIDDVLYCFNITNCTTPPIPIIESGCFEPFVETKYDGVFVFGNGNKSFQCGLRCEYTQVLWSVEDSEIALVDTTFGICSIIFLITSIILSLNICSEIHHSKETCYQRNFLFHAPVCLVICYTVIALCFLLPLIIGKDTITCANDIDGVQTFGSYNPGGSTLCTVMGILFYSSTMLMGGYTAMFSISLWSEFYAPLDSIWIELQSKSYCKCCCSITETISSVMPNCDLDICPSTSCCSSKSWKHYIIYLTAIIYTICGYLDKGIQSVPIIGICTIGSRDTEQTITYNIIPHSIFVILSTLFLPCAIILLIGVGKRGNDHMRSTFKRLKWRLLVYFLCIEIAWFGDVFILTFIFHTERDKFEVAAEERTTCMLMKGTADDYDECMSGYTYWFGWYALTGFILPISGLGSLILSCNQRNWEQWKMILNPWGILKSKKHKGSIVLSTTNTAIMDKEKLTATATTIQLQIMTANEEEQIGNDKEIDTVTPINDDVDITMNLIVNKQNGSVKEEAQYVA